MEENKLIETFQREQLNEKLNWHNEPSNWYLKDEQLQIFPDASTDFWQKTHYGFQADNGHFLYSIVNGDFVIETHVQCNFKHQYDQAGLMIRVSDQCWVKTAVEFEPEEANKLGAVVTNHGFSDWSTQDVEDSFTDFKLRVIRKGSSYKVQYYNSNSNEWVQLRMFHLFDEPVVMAGVYACSPKDAPFSASFNYLKIQ